MHRNFIAPFRTVVFIEGYFYLDFSKKNDIIIITQRGGKLHNSTLLKYVRNDLKNWINRIKK